MTTQIRTWIKNSRTGPIDPVIVLFTLGVGFAAGLLLAGGQSSPPKHSDAHAHTDGNAKKDTIWTCSMHPQIRQPNPGKCPICGMDLIPLADDGDKPGPRTVVMSERAKLLAQIGTTEVRRRKMAATDLRLLGRIEPNETAVKNVTAWTGGRIDHLHVKVTGQSVRAGQVVATLYSPEVFSAHQDLLVAKKQVEKMKDGTESALNAVKRALEASRTRLRLLGVDENELSNLEQQDKPTTKAAIRTPFAGTVTERVATEGAYVSTGALLYRVVNLSSVWVQLDAYESDLPSLSKGQEVEIQVEGLANEVFKGAITFIDPTLDPARRVARVRVEVKNRDGRLRPGMFVEAEVKSSIKDGAKPPLVIPETAPLFTGHRAIVFVEDVKATRPTYLARTVRLGLKSGNEYPVIAGLSEGERVVTKGAFTLDADLQIRGGESMMTEPDDSRHEDTDRILPVTTLEQKKTGPVMTAYLEIQKQLAADDFNKAKTASAVLEKAAKKVQLTGAQAVSEFWNAHRKHIIMQAKSFSAAASIEQARGVFETLSNQMIVLLERIGNPLDTSVRLTFCPMAFGSKGAHWLQPAEVVDNPYYGNAMRTCGEIQKTIDAGTHLLTERDTSKTMAPATQTAPAGGHNH
ncbi:MAG: efflux RND transporter periplasmic adaptor subunit [Deltaproteobacteria bacterium]|nr:efflux RND transporter periplasmic adaptor subunit [Deltaproteobacteria bacterium]